MKILINAIKFGFPLLLITDMTSVILHNQFILGISQTLRSIFLLLFIIENIRYRSIIKTFYFAKFLLLFALVLFLFVFTDKNLLEGFWMFFRFLFWVLGINVLYAYAFLNIFSFKDFLKVAKMVVVLVFLITIYYLATGFIKDDYNIAAYLIVSIYPLILYSSESFTKNKLLLVLCVFSVFITVKRGAIMAFSISTLLYYFGSLYSHFSVKRIFYGVVFFTVLIFSSIYIIEGQEDRLEDRLSEEQFDVNNDKAGSGRVGMYTKLFSSWYNSNNLLTGFGNQADSNRHQGKRRTHAHSDIFGFLYNFGLIGIILIFLFYRKIILFHIKIKNLKGNNPAMVLVLFSILFLVNLYSGLFYITETIYLFALLPYLQIEYMRSAQENSKPL